MRVKHEPFLDPRLVQPEVLAPQVVEQAELVPVLAEQAELVPVAPGRSEPLVPLGPRVAEALPLPRGPGAKEQTSGAEEIAHLAVQIESGDAPPDRLSPARAGDLPITELAPLNIADVFSEVGRAAQKTDDLPLHAAAFELLQQTAMLTPPSQPGVVAQQLAANPQLVALLGQAVRASVSQRKADTVLDLGGVDIETMCSLVLLECGKDATDDVREMLAEMQQTKQRKDAMRRQLQATRERQREMEGVLRKEYDARRALDPDNAQYIPPGVTFEQYEQQRSVVFPLNDDGVYDGSQDAQLGSDAPLYPKAPPASGTGGPGATAPTGTTPGTLTDEQKALAAKYGLSAAQLAPVSACYTALTALFPELLDSCPTLDAFLSKPQLPCAGFGPYAPACAAPSGLSATNKGGNPAALAALFGSFKSLLTEQNLEQALKSQYRDMFTTDFLANGVEAGETDSTSASGLAKLRDDLAAKQTRFDQLAAVGKQLFGGDFAASTAQMKLDVVAEAQRTLPATLDSIVPGHDFEKYRDLAAWLLANPGSPTLLVPGFDNLGGLRVPMPPAIAQITRLAIGVGMTSDELANLLHRTDRDKQKTADFFRQLIKPGDAKGSLEQELDAAQHDHSPPGNLLSLIDAALAAATSKPGHRSPLVGNEELSAKATTITPATVTATAARSQVGTFGDFATACDKQQNDLDSLSELNEQMSLRLQMAMDRMQKFYTTLSNLMKKQSDTTSDIVGNLK